MKTTVMDASIGLAVVLREPAARTLRTLLAEGMSPYVPASFWLEVINVLARRHRRSGNEILEAARELDEMGIETVEMDAVARVATIDLVERHGLTAYDAIYLSLADMLDAQLLTADRRLAAAAGSRALLVGPDGQIAESPTAYEVTPTWPAWRGAAAYLGQLRREAARTETDAGRLDRIVG
jgi:predicted nucleic acid-binding protein